LVFFYGYYLRSISLSDCNFIGPVYLYAQETLIDRSSFNFINNYQILTIDSSFWEYSNHTVFNNTFLNNTLTTPELNYASVISFSSTNNDVTLSKNYFKCNYIGKTVARVLPSTITIDNHWVISDNIIDPSCPYLCLNGSEPVYNGIAGCVACAKGWISPGGTSPCTPCPPGTSPSPGTNNCTLCDDGNYTPGFNYSYCRRCDWGTTSSQNHTECIPCPKYYYANDKSICVKCTSGASSACNCGFFTSIESDCTELSTLAIIVIAVASGLVFLPFICSLLIVLVREYRTKGYIKLY